MSLSNWFKILSHILRGHLRLYQCYTNVNWRTCEVCLSWHGRIVAHPKHFPAHNSCPHEVLAFSVWRLGEYRAKGERMRAKAQSELDRREKWRRARELLPHDASAALALFQEAAQVDVYLAEVEELLRETAAWLRENPAVQARLRQVLVAGWKAKFAKERYERQPELARTAQEKFGLERLQELLS